MQTRVLAAFVICLAGFIIALLVLTAGTRVNFLENATLAILGNYYYGDGGYTSRSIVGHSDASSSGYDWYALYYLSVCYGDYTLDAYGYRNGRTTVGCDTGVAPWANISEVGRAFVPWTVGVALAGVAFLVCPFFFRGTWHHNTWLMWCLFLSWVALMIGGIFGTVYASVEPYSGSVGSQFIPLTWSAVACVFVAWVFEFVEYALQRFTPRGQPISVKYKPAEVPWISADRRVLAHAVNQDMGMMRADVGAGMNLAYAT